MRSAAHAYDDISADYEVREAIGRYVDATVTGLLPRGEIFKTMRRWLSGHSELPEDNDARTCLMTMAADLELFTPSASGVTAIDRVRNKTQPQTETERAALAALSAAQFRLVRIADRESPALVRLTDLVTHESLVLLDAYISPLAAGWVTAMRLCPLPSGRQVLISPLFALDETLLAAAMKFVRPDRPLSQRYAASLYRDVARRGFLPVPQQTSLLTETIATQDDGEEAESAVAELARRWIDAPAAARTEELVRAARQLASAENLVDACGLYGQAGANAPDGLRDALERIAGLQIETILERRRAGMSFDGDALKVAGTMIAHFVAEGAMAESAQTLFQRLLQRHSASPHRSHAKDSDDAAELARVIGRIQALRAKTVAQGCTEEEAMAAAAKVAELLARYDLSLDEISVRNADCQGVSLATGRKRRAPVDSCLQPLAHFCDCHIWSEEQSDGTLHYTLFGLKHDAEAARVLHELIELTFETESASFRYGEIYLTAQGGDRRLALNSFQVGLASGINAKLHALKSARTASTASSGFDLVAVKQSVVDAEIARLGLNLTTRARRKRRTVHGEAFAAGKAAGSLFEPNAVLAS